MMMFDQAASRRYAKAGALAFRLSIAALLALWLSQVFKVGLPLWAVLTALIVTQISLGRSLKATLDYFAGTIGGVLWGASVAMTVPHTSESGLLLVLLLALGPLAFIGALYPRLSVGPITAAIVVLIPEMMHTSPVDSALERVEEVLLGGTAGLFISFVLLPSSAFQHTREVAAQALERMADAVPGLIEGFEHGLDETGAHQLQDGIGHKLSELASIAAEAERERPLRFSDDPLTGPLFRTLLRLRHDLVILGRVVQFPLPPQLKPWLQSPLVGAGHEISSYLRACASALLSKGSAPVPALESAIARYTAQLAMLRKAGHLRNLPGDDVERLYATNFALDQIRLNLIDLEHRIADWSHRE